MTTLRHRILAATGALALAATLAACGGSSGSTDAASGQAGSDAGGSSSSSQTLTVFAAASLAKVYEKIGTEFEEENPGVTVTFSTGGSNDLVTQISQGAPADVLATADEKNMDKAVDQGLIQGDPIDFATNELTIAVQPGNPKGITGLGDLAKPDLTVVRCASEVPCGTVSDQVLQKAGVTLTPASEENSVTDVLNKVTSGEADAGLVYVTDVAGSGGKAEKVDIPEAAEFRTTYPIATVKGTKNEDLAKKFEDFVVSEKGQAALQDAGFGTP